MNHSDPETAYRGPRDDEPSGRLPPFTPLQIEQSIPERFRCVARIHADRPAVASRGRRLRYAELDALSEGVARELVARCGTRAEPVATLLPQGALCAIAILGILKAGKFYVCLDPTKGREDQRRVLDACGAAVLLCDRTRDRLARELVGYRGLVVEVEGVEPFTGTAPALPEPLPSSLAYVFFTSGSTGAPKGVFDTHRNVLHNVMRYTRSLRIGFHDSLTLLQAPSFSGAVSSLFGALLNGACVMPVDLADETPGSLAEWIRSEKITIYHSVPSIFRSVAGHGCFPDVRWVRLEGDQASRRDIELFGERFAPGSVLVNGLGTTETGLICQYFVPHGQMPDGPVVPIGRPVEDMEVELLDVEDGVGEIAVRSRHLAGGYWDDPSLTSAVFRDDPPGSGFRLYRTGDLGRRRADGGLDYLGRRDGARARIRGEWVEIAEVEGTLLGVTGIREAAVAVLGDVAGERRLVAYVVPESDARPTTSALRRAVAARLERHKVPARFEWVERLPLGANAKLDRSALPVPGERRPELDSDFAAGNNLLERALVQIWEELLGVRPVGIYDDFFDLGGHSLLAAEMLSRIEERFGRFLDASALLGGPTVERLAGALLRQESELQSPLTLLNEQGTRKPFFFLHGDYLSEGFYALELARHLGPDQPLGLLAPCGVDGRPVPRCYASMARRHLEALRSIGASGPFRIGGHCNGAHVAYELARELVSRGEVVELLLLSYGSAANLRLRPMNALLGLIGGWLGWGQERRWAELRRLSDFLESLDPLPAWRRPVPVIARGVVYASELLRSAVARRAEESEGADSGLDPGARTATGPREGIAAIYQQLDAEWIPGPFPGVITLLWPEDDPVSGEVAAGLWRRLAPEVRLFSVPGDHTAIVSRHVGRLAEVISECLARTDAG